MQERLGVDITVMGVGGVLHPYGTGKSHPGGAGYRKEDALHEPSPGSTAVTRGAEDERESAKESQNANKDERKTGEKPRDRASFRRRDCPYQIQKLCTKIKQPGSVLF